MVHLFSCSNASMKIREAVLRQFLQQLNFFSNLVPIHQINSQFGACWVKHWGKVLPQLTFDTVLVPANCGNASVWKGLGTTISPLFVQTCMCYLFLKCRVVVPRMQWLTRLLFVKSGLFLFLVGSTKGWSIIRCTVFYSSGKQMALPAGVMSEPLFRQF